MEERPFGYVTRLSGDFKSAVERVKASLKQQGFGTLTEVDVRETLREKLGATFHDYVIIGACNPPLAHQALATNPEIGLFLPCNVIVYREADGQILVEATAPPALLAMAGVDGLQSLAAEADQRIRVAIQSLETAG